MTLRLGCVAIAMAVLLLPGCAGPLRKDAVPTALTASAVIPGLPDVRYRVGIDTAAIQREGLDSVRREQAYRAAQGHHGPLPSAFFLAVSGGGDDGAFGAGLLNGWTAAGNRPEFKLVTGVSTGALTAPFAFLGPAYDDQLKRVYTGVTSKDILKKRPLLAALTSDALSDNAPLWKLVEREFNQSMLDAIAREYDKGRLLLVATADLDARQAVTGT